MSKATWMNRRQILRGAMAGGVVSIGLPILDCMLNTNGDAFAASGEPVPVRFGTWFWGLGFGEGQWVPKDAGANYELPGPMAPLAPMKKKLNLFTGAEVFLEGKANETHFTGAQGLMTGRVGSAREYSGSLDTFISEVIGTRTRFRSIEVTCDGDPKSGWSAPKDGERQLAEVSPLALYTRVFGEEFKDPNAADFVPDPAVMVRRSALSAVTERRASLMNEVGAADRIKLDAYFSSLRALEQKLDAQLRKPEPLLACTRASEPAKEDKQAITIAPEAMERHDLFTDILAHALACGQTNVINLSVTHGMSGLRQPGETDSHHTLTHEEPIDPELGYQKRCAVFQNQYMNGLLRFATKLDSIVEGDKTLLDRMLVFCFTDHGAPRLHSVRNMPIITLGSANGRMKTGLHVPRPADQVTRVGLTAQQIMGVATSSWGVGANRVTSPISEVIA